jgi:hypothetical protein
MTQALYAHMNNKKKVFPWDQETEELSVGIGLCVCR